ncbi:hypothetical protein NEILACOT_04240 [Neisseria lactamica ATCC 23970]|uniref:Uncharacterized protein n=1 Tax=Neisseria lactamica ATCC 23970 TaxID=546265 RepID=D0W9M8_NEILA|nr:hypothetical protein NEILACOT_04240 [Neisseria lactamica ATCC 23970]
MTEFQTAFNVLSGFRRHRPPPSFPHKRESRPSGWRKYSKVI